MKFRRVRVGGAGALARRGVRVLQTPYRAPKANAYVEQLVRSIKEESLNRLIRSTNAITDGAVTEFFAHYHRERNRQEFDDELTDGSACARVCSLEYVDSNVSVACELLRTSSVNELASKFGSPPS